MELIRGIAWRFRLRWLRDELESAGLVGYARALAAYREDSQVPFDAYAATMVRREMQDFLRVWVPGSRNRDRFPVPTFVTVTSDIVDPTEPVVDRLCREAEIEARLARLKPRLQRVVRLRLQDATMEEIGTEMGMSFSNASRMNVKAIAKMRKAVA